MKLIWYFFSLALLAPVTTISSDVQNPRADLVRKGSNADWLPANKSGFGTSYSTSSKVWFTLEGGRLSEVYYPRLDTPSVRNLDFVVTDGQSFAVRAQDESTSTRLVNTAHGRKDHGGWREQADAPHSLTYQIVNTDTANRWRLTTTFVTDPFRPTLLIDVKFTSLNGQTYQLYLVYQPQLNNPVIAAPLNESGVTQGNALLATDAQMQVASALVASPPFTETSNGYLGPSDGWTDLNQHYQLTAQSRSASNGTVVQTGRLPLSGLNGSQDLTLALGFASAESAALHTANASLRAGFDKVSEEYAEGWAKYLDSLRDPPSSLSTKHERQLYAASAMVLAASEDKTYRGAFIASPTMPWAFGTGLINPSGNYHAVWPRDLYEIVTALIVDGDLSGAGRGLDYLFNVQQKPDGSFPQNTKVDGTPVFPGLQLDEVAYPLILAYQLGHKDPNTWSQHVKPAANFLLNFVSPQGHPAPYTPQDRWEEQNGYSPSSIASEIAGLVCAADIARANGDAGSVQRYLAAADSWRSQVEKWTVTKNGPYRPLPYYIRLTKDGNPNAGVTYNLGNGGPNVDQRKVADAGFLELVRLGIKPAYDGVILNSLKIVDAQLASTTSNGRFWHRYTEDGYGETSTGTAWAPMPSDTFMTHGRLWSILAGERGEYDLAAHNELGAKACLMAISRAANDGDLFSEQVWDNQPPAGRHGFASGAATTSATPLAWAHAQFIRLAFDIAAGRLVEQPSIVAQRYLHRQPASLIRRGG
ncbi:MAG TPA: glycoside hydrolase family 15 protein [Chthoniobacterales bacterium]|nr:glycoside hydrolase family 15 protein [Chthoniobacterales bacterium]